MQARGSPRESFSQWTFSPKMKLQESVRDDHRYSPTLFYFSYFISFYFILFYFILFYSLAYFLKVLRRLE